MGLALGYAATGLVGLGLMSLLIWLAATRLRKSDANSVWAGDWMATLIALLLVAGLVISGAQLVNGLLQVFPDAVTATAIGIATSSIVPLVVFRILSVIAGSKAGAEQAS